ncbi:hypothetical protein HZH68_007590 [Vespula germanica]|uniref:Uncharacterized protein n=1 Tax=Vespula germanica TaxID=30212 RepID=A0A834K8E2_VESGE|nr:hypothetical protein HZH68_007590 [Vespula germanica]
MICEEVAGRSAPIPVSSIRQSIGPAETAIENQDLYAGHMIYEEIMQGIGSREAAIENQDFYAGHMTYEEVARCNAAFSLSSITTFWVKQGIGSAESAHQN